MATTTTRSGELRAWLVKLAIGVVIYWLLLLVTSLPVFRAPAVLQPVLIACALPVLIAVAIALWRRSRSGLNDLAFKDDLTGLANRRAFREQAASMLNEATPGSIAVVLLDVDGLKTLNDGCGHQTGDELLLRLADQLTRLAPDPLCVYRIGGDEFAILIDRSMGHGIANVIGQLEPVKALFASCSHEHSVDVSYGYASNLPAEAIDTLFKRADERLRDCKRRQYSSGDLRDRRASARPRDFEEDEQAPVMSNITSLQERRLSRLHSQGSS